MKRYIMMFVALAGLALAFAPVHAAPASVSSQARLPARIDYKSLSSLLEDSSSRLLLLDVRTAEEFGAGHIPGAVLAPYDGLEAGFREPDKGRPIVVYCRSGRRSAIALETLRRMGYTNLSDFGAVDNWKGRLAR